MSNANIKQVLNSIGEQYVRLYDATCTLECVRAALHEPDDAATAACNAESAVLLVTQLLNETISKIELAVMAGHEAMKTLEAGEVQS